MSIARYMPANGDRGVGTVVRNDASGTVVFYDDYAAEVARLNEQVRALAAEVQNCRRFVVEHLGPDSGIEFSHLDNKFAESIMSEIRAQSRAEGIIFATNRLLAAWESGFVYDTPEMVYDISGAILSALESLPNADEGEFKRDYADEVRARIHAGEVSNG